MNQQPSFDKMAIKTAPDQVKSTHQQSNFIQKAYQLVNNSKNSEIIHWSRSGLTFIIEDIQRFQKQLLPLYFRHNRYQSFVRQLNMYDFHKIRNGDYYCDNKSQFRHEEFSRGNIQTILQIKRKGFQARNNQKENTKNKKIYKNSSRKILRRKKPTPVKQKVEKKLDKIIYQQDENSFFVELSIEPQYFQKSYQVQNKQDKFLKIIEQIINFYSIVPQNQALMKKSNKISEAIQLAQRVKDKWIENFEKIAGSQQIKAIKRIYYQIKDKISKPCSVQQMNIFQNIGNCCQKCNSQVKRSNQNQKIVQMDLLQQEDAIIQSIFRAEIRSTLICITSQTFLNNAQFVRRYDTLMGI